MAADTQAFLADPDQAARREELRAFIGPDAELFLKTYDGMAARAQQPPGEKKVKLVRGFVPLAFLLGPCWFFYRKLWAWAGGICALMVGLVFVPFPTGRIGLPLGLAMGMMARTLYLDYAMRRITALRGAAPRADLAVLAQAGGVSKPAGWISGVLLGSLIALGIVSIIYLYRVCGIDAIPQ